MRGQTIRTTAEHPFHRYVDGWVACNRLRVGDRIALEEGWAEVEGLVDTGSWETVYNFRIAEFHTYFVGCDEWGFSVWAHNNNRGVVVETAKGFAVKRGDDVLRVLPTKAAANAYRRQVEKLAKQAAHAQRSLAVETAAEIARPGEQVRRFGTKAQIKDAKKNGIAFDPDIGNGIPTTRMTVEPKYPDSIIEMTGARSADYHMVIDISGKRVLRTTTGSGNIEIRVMETINAKDVIKTGRVARN